MRRAFFLITLVMAAAVSSGCASVRNIFYPGNIEQQQRFATLHDPYPDNQAGPEVLGGRPPSYDRPMPEAKRSTYARDYFMWGR